MNEKFSNIKYEGLLNLDFFSWIQAEEQRRDHMEKITKGNVSHIIRTRYAWIITLQFLDDLQNDVQLHFRIFYQFADVFGVAFLAPIKLTFDKNL